MIDFSFGLSSGRDVHCPFCGVRVGYDNEGDNLGDCKHHIYYTSDLVDPVSEYEILKIDNLYEDFNEDNDFWLDFIKKKLDKLEMK